MKINIYPQEALDGLEEAIANNNSISYCTKVEKHSIQTKLSDSAIASIQSIAGKFDINLFYPTKSILATTSWNLNDDVFGPKETWAARYSPIHTPTNIDHDHNKTVGHIIGTWSINAKGELISDDTKEEDLPNKFHLCNSALIYKFPRGKDLVARAQKLIEEIEEDKKFVSMECLFPGFDYAVISPDKDYYIIERNESTAFLTKHLKIYGGKGMYEGKKIGRFLKNMVFSGKGYVDVPANPESIIFDSDSEFDFSSASYQDKWFDIKDKTMITVPVDVAKSFTQSDNTETELMADENKQIEELKAENIKLQKQLGEVNAKALNDEITELKAQLTTAKSEVDLQKGIVEELSKKGSEAEKAVADLNTKIEQLTTEKTELATKVQEAEAIKIRTQRVSKLVEGGVDKEDAEAKVTKFANLSDEQFDALAEVLVKPVPAKGETTKTETVVDDTTLTTAKVEETAAGVTVDDDKITNEAASLRLSIAKKLGYEDPTETDGE
jgi:hypothetical protein